MATGMATVTEMGMGMGMGMGMATAIAMATEMAMVIHPSERHATYQRLQRRQSRSVLLAMEHPRAVLVRHCSRPWMEAAR
jgi:hypothetical protein